MKKKYIHNPETHRINDAEIILPLVFKEISPRSVVDVGCGTGTFLAACEKLGVADILGVDGDYVDRSMLRIKPEQFLAADLSKPLSLGKRFDLVICLEVAEHIAPKSADIFVKSLVELGDVVLFSAAIPGQGGQNHLNEQWPSYWRGIFQRHGYDYHDLLRGELWDDPRIFWWYKQNMFLAVKNGRKPMLPSEVLMLNAIHPELWMQLVNDRKNPTVWAALRKLVKAVVLAARSTIRK